MIKQIQNKDNNPNTQIPVCQPLPVEAFIIQYPSPIKHIASDTALKIMRTLISFGCI